MELKRVVISFFLIFSYTVGFAHSVIPHCDNLLNGNHIHNTAEGHNHQHHDHSDFSHKDHEHITHGNHFDKGIYDLLICLFSDLEHGESECNMQHNNPIEPSIEYNQQEYIKFISIFSTISGDIKEIEQQRLSKLSESAYYSPELSAQSLRGPPSK